MAASRKSGKHPKSAAKREKPSSKPRSASAPAAAATAAAPKPLPRPTARARFAAISIEHDRLQKTVELERAERMAEYKAELDVAQSRVATASRSLSLAATGVPRIVAEGDSWFDYPPGRDIYDYLKSTLRIPIAKMAHHGDEVRDMLALKQRKEIETRLANGAPDGQPWDAMLFSGGGNDLVGDEMCLWLNTYSSGMTPAQVLNSGRFGAALNIVEAGYRDLMELRQRLSPNTKLFFHQYDFAPPNNKGVCGVGPWLKPSLDYRLVPLNMQQAVVNLILQQFATLLAMITTGVANVFVVPTQGTLPAPTNQWWANEIHPTDAGFAAIGDKFRIALKKEFPQLP